VLSKLFKDFPENETTGTSRILRSMHALALRYSDARRRQEALQLIETVVASHKMTLGEEHPDTLASMHNLAILNETRERIRHLYAKAKVEPQIADSANINKHLRVGRLWRKFV
jgi:hypothetical protein